VEENIVAAFTKREETGHFRWSGGGDVARSLRSWLVGGGDMVGVYVVLLATLGV
jgi:hypothetical protein